MAWPAVAVTAGTGAGGVTVVVVVEAVTLSVWVRLGQGLRLVFGDMMQYSFVKNTHFNGMPLPDIGMLDADGGYRVLGTFGYDDFRRRLG